MGERRLVQPGLLVELEPGERRRHVVGVEREDLLVIGDCLAPVDARARVRRASEERGDSLLALRVPGGDEPLGSLDPPRALVAALGEVAREEEPLHGRSRLRRPPRELPRAMLGRIVGARRAQIARVCLENARVPALDEPLEGLHRALDRACVLGRGLRVRSGRAPGGGRIPRVGRELDVRVRPAAGVRQAQRQQGSSVVAAHLRGQPVPSRSQAHRAGESIAVEVAVLLVVQHLGAVPEDAQGARSARPHGDPTCRAAGEPSVPHERRQVPARLLGRPEKDAQIGPAVRRCGRQDAPPRGPVVLAVVVVREIHRERELLLRLVRGEEAGLAVVVERPETHPLVDEPEVRDAPARPVQIAAAPPGVRLQQRRVRPDRSRLPGVERHVAQCLFDGGGIAAIPLRPDAAQRHVSERPAGAGDVRAELREPRKAIRDLGVHG